MIENKTYLQTVTYLQTQTATATETQISTQTATETATATATQIVQETALSDCLGKVSKFSFPIFCLSVNPGLPEVQEQLAIDVW